MNNVTQKVALVPLLFSFKGRISRQPYWLSTLGMSAIMLLPAYFFGFGTDTDDTYVEIMSVAFLWPVLAVQVKRWHDLDKSAWWILINFIPLGVIWSLVENGFFQGTSGTNRFGSDPLGHEGGF